MAVTFACDGIRTIYTKSTNPSGTAWNSTAYVDSYNDGGQAGPGGGTNQINITVLRFKVPSISYTYDAYKFKMNFKYVSNLTAGANGTVYFYLKDPTKTSEVNYYPTYDATTGHYLSGTSNNPIVGSANFKLDYTNS